MLPDCEIVLKNALADTITDRDDATGEDFPLNSFVDGCDAEVDKSRRKVKRSEVREEAEARVATLKERLAVRVLMVPSPERMYESERERKC